MMQRAVIGSELLSSKSREVLPSIVGVLLLSIALTSSPSLGQLEADGEPVRQSAIEGLFGQIAKTVIYSGATLARVNSRLWCSLLRLETGHDNQEQPTLFLFKNSLRKEQAFRIYSDDEINLELLDEAQLDADQPTIIFVHGWLGGIHNEYWLTEAKNLALKASDELRAPPSSGLEERAQVRFATNHSNAGSSCSSKHESLAVETRNVSKRRAKQASTNFEHDQDFDPANGWQEARPMRLYRPNVVIVDWSEFASGSLFTATQNSHKVARRLGRLLEQLAAVGHLRPELMHCLGHSIGAHICGQAARHAFPVQPRAAGGDSLARPWQARQKRMGRITALDPGGFCYEHGIRNESSFAGLRPSDALLTDAYYSNRSPFGNRFQVAQYNVRLNNAFLQSACSVWRNTSVAAEYFRASVRFAMGNIGHNDVLTCDHYFATRFAHQTPSEQCSYVAYACDTYRNFVRGRCAKCDQSDQCYLMDFEYQRREPSNEHALEQIRRHSSLLNARFSQASLDSPPGGVPYKQRRSFYMRVTSKQPYCSHTYRVRVQLNHLIQDLKSFRADAVQLQLLGVVTMRDSSTDKLTSGVLSLHGPWLDGNERDFFGLNNRTLTGLFELRRPERIRGLLVDYDNERNRQHIPHMQLIESIHFDYLSSTDPKIKAKFSSHFDADEVEVQFKRIDRQPN